SDCAESSWLLRPLLDGVTGLRPFFPSPREHGDVLPADDLELGGKEVAEIAVGTAAITNDVCVVGDLLGQHVLVLRDLVVRDINGTGNVSFCVFFRGAGVQDDG